MARYTKTYSSPAQLVTLLQSRGLHVENVARTENKPGATFNQALDMYRFDRHLRH